MRTSHTATRTPQRRAQKPHRKGLQILAICSSCALVAVALTLTLTFGLRRTPTEEEANQPVVAPPPAITFVAPLETCKVSKAAALNRLVYNDTLRQWRTHNGVDFEAAAGTDVLGIADGTVTEVENTILEGVVVSIAHAEGYVSVYKGLGEAYVAKGDTVRAGSEIGSVGTMMCEKNAGAHLHLELSKDGKLVSATEYIENLGADK